MTHLYISSPTHHAPDPLFVDCWSRLAVDLRLANVSHTMELPAGESHVDRARNNVVARFIASPATHLFFIDSDQTFSTADVLEMVVAKKPIVGALIPKKGIDWSAVRDAAQSGLQDIEGHGAQYVVNPGKMTVAVEPPGLVPVDAVGTGFLCIERAVIATIIEAHPEIAYETDDHVSIRHPRWAVFDAGVYEEQGHRRFLTEDYVFCRRARSLGIQPWLHIGVQDICHVGRYIYRGNVAAAFRLHRKGE